jgi:tetratricopeptide (TPR) repeat protein
LRLWDHLNARSIRAAFADEILPTSAPLWRHNFVGAMGRLAQDLGPIGPGLAIACVVVLVAGRNARSGLGLVILWVSCVELFYVVGINPMGGAERQTGLPLSLLAALAVGLVIGPWARGPSRLRRAMLPLIGTVVVVPAALASSADVIETRSWGAHAWTRAALGQLPPGALLLTQTDDLAAGVTAAMVLEGARPDVTTAPAQHLYRPMSEWAGARPRDRAIWTAAAREASEADRIEAAIETHEGAVALEHPGVRLFAAVDWWSSLGRVPLGIAGPGLDPTTVSPVTGADEIDRWLPRLSGREDRTRLAEAVANRARGRLSRQPDAVADAVLAFEDVIRRVLPDHPSTLVGLAVLYARRGELTRAIALTRAALAIEPERNAALLNLALYLSSNPGTRAEAEAVAARAAELRPWRVDVWQRLAQVREAAGDEEGAQEARERAMWAAGRR